MDSSVLLHGRPFGGCAILFRKSIISSVSMLQTNATHFCAVLLSDQSGSSILLICVYLPTAYASPTSTTDFLLVLGEIEGFIATQSYDSLLIIGDFNVDFARGGTNATHLSRFMDDYYLSAVDLCFPHIQFTFEGPLGSKSWIDHVLSSRSLAAHVIQKLDFGTNLSDHQPLSVELQFHFIVQPRSHPSHLYHPPLALPGTRFLNTMYTHMIANSLPSFPSDLFTCSDTQCSFHRSAIDFCCSALLCCILQAALHSLPTVKKCGNSIPGWNDAARLYKSKAKFWHKVWCEAGSPSTGVLFQIKRASKRRFKYEVRRLKRQQMHQRRRRMASALASSNEVITG